jgi:hypothetical protein
MEVTEKEDGLDPKAQAQQPEPEKGPVAHGSEKEVTAQPEANPSAPGKDVDREAPESAPREAAQPQPADPDADLRDWKTHDQINAEHAAAQAERDANPHSWVNEHGNRDATKAELEKWNSEHPDHPDAQRDARAAERATDSARGEPVWDESVPSATGGEHEYAESAQEPSPHGERMGDAIGGSDPEHGHQQKQECMAPQAKTDVHDFAASAAADKAMEERMDEVKARVSWYGDRAPQNDVEHGIARSLAEEHRDLYNQIHERMEKDRAMDPTAHPDPYLAPKEATKEPQGPEQKGEIAHPERAQQQPEAARPPQDKLAQLVKMQMEQERNAHNAKVMAEAEIAGKQPVHEAGRNASSMEARLGSGAAKTPTVAAKTPPKDKGMEREM